MIYIQPMKYFILTTSLISSSKSVNPIGTNIETKDHTYKSVTLHVGGSKNLDTQNKIDNTRMEGCIGFYSESIIRYNG